MALLTGGGHGELANSHGLTHHRGPVVHRHRCGVGRLSDSGGPVMTATTQTDGGAASAAPSHLDYQCPTCKVPAGERCRRDRFATYIPVYYPATSGHASRIALVK